MGVPLGWSLTPRKRLGYHSGSQADVNGQDVFFEAMIVARKGLKKVRGAGDNDV